MNHESHKKHEVKGSLHFVPFVFFVAQNSSCVFCNVVCNRTLCVAHGESLRHRAESPFVWL